jgi:hypothetical protein
MREKLIDIVETYADFLDWDTKYDLVDAVEELFAADNNVSRKWIPVTERLPEKNNQWVLCLCVGGAMEVLKFDYVMWNWDSQYPSRCYMESYVTHWMPLPEPPKGE